MARPKGRFVTPKDAPRPPGSRPVGRPRKVVKEPRPPGAPRLGRRPNWLRAAENDDHSRHNKAPTPTRVLRSISAPEVSRQGEPSGSYIDIANSRGIVPPRVNQGRPKRQRLTGHAKVSSEDASNGRVDDSDSDDGGVIADESEGSRSPPKRRNMRRNRRSDHPQTPVYEYSSRAMTKEAIEATLGLDLLSPEQLFPEDEMMAEMDPSGVDDTYLRVDGSSTAWIELWQTTLQIFQASPHHIFTWGLRLSPNVTRTEARLLWRDLREVLTHPIWGNRMSELRYFLQKAICLRLPDHAEPLFPLSPEMTDTLTKHRTNAIVDLGIDLVKVSTMFQDLTYDLWKQGWPETQTNGARLFRQMEKVFEQQREAAFISEEVSFFVLERRDVLLIRESLDSLANQGWFECVEFCVNEYCHVTTQTLLLPSDVDQVTEWDNGSMFIKKRDRAILLPDISKSESVGDDLEWYWRHPECDIRLKNVMYQSHDDGDGEDANYGGDGGAAAAAEGHNAWLAIVM